MKPSSSRSPCPVVFALDIFGDRWTLLIIRDMALRGRTTFGELQSAGEGISTNILADRMKRLQEAEVVTKEPDPCHGSRAHYRLTNKGLDLIPMLVEMMRWSAQHDPDSPLSKSFRQRLRKDPQGVASEFLAKAKVQ